MLLTMLIATFTFCQAEVSIPPSEWSPRTWPETCQEEPKWTTTRRAFERELDQDLVDDASAPAFQQLVANQRRLLARRLAKDVDGMFSMAVALSESETATLKAAFAKSVRGEQILSYKILAIDVAEHRTSVGVAVIELVGEQCVEDAFYSDWVMVESDWKWLPRPWDAVITD